MNRLAIAAAMSAVGLVVSSASALNVVLDYSNDTGYFASNPTARATIEKAAGDLSAMITTTLNATLDTNVGVNNTTTATFDHSFAYTNPSTGGSMTVPLAVLPQNEVRIFVGRQNLSGSTLAQGGPGAYGFTVGASGFASEIQGAVTNGSNASTANLLRGGGPTIGTLSGTLNFNLGANDPTYSISYGSTLGNLWFDSDTNNDAAVDSDAQFGNYFQLDYTQPVGGGKIDLYSVALHEMLHAIGIGTSESWDSNIGGDGNDWTGAAVSALLGTGNNNAVVDGHISGAVGASTVFGSSTPQTAVMIPSIGFGERRFLTALDAAFLTDINWTVAAVPEPTSIAAVALAFAAFGRRRRAIA